MTLNVRMLIQFFTEHPFIQVGIQDLSSALCQFDRRTIELLLTRAERSPPPSHLRDFGIATLMETHGRERRNRYYTLASYRDLVTRERLDHSTDAYVNVDFNDVGGFNRFDPNLFYEEDAVLCEYQDKFRDKEKARIGKPRRYPLKNPILPDGSVKQGRPRKHPLPSIAEDSTATPGKSESGNTANRKHKSNQTQ